MRLDVFTEEQEDFRQMVRSFVAREGVPHSNGSRRGKAAVW